MPHTLKLENQDGDIYYRDFFRIKKYTFTNSKIKAEGVYHEDNKSTEFYIHGISFKNKTTGENFARFLNDLRKEKPHNVLYQILLMLEPLNTEKETDAALNRT